MHLKKKYLIYLISCFVGCFTFFSNDEMGSYLKKSRQQVSVEDPMPIEYSILSSILKRLASSNNLGDETIYFIVDSGSYANWLAMELDFCEKEDCTFFKGLNPFLPFKGANQHETNEIKKQSYLLGGIEASASANNNVLISRSTFKVVGNRFDILAFIMAHEISHIMQDSSFIDSLKESRKGKRLNKKERERLSYEISRESEVKADQQACSILYNSGYPLETCTDAIHYVHKESGDGEETKDNSTHPGYEDRMLYMENYQAELLKKGRVENTFDSGLIEYETEINLLRYTPIKNEEV